VLPRQLPLATALAGLALAGPLTACSTGPTDAVDAAATASTSASPDAGAFPMTIANDTFGDVTIEDPPTRVAALGTQDGDNLLALGVVPVGVTKVSWGGDAQGSTPWFQERLAQLDAQMPTQYSDVDGVPIEEIAEVAPDLILATNYSLTRQQYDKLSEIAPVVAYPGDPWTTTWQDSLELDGRALGLSDEAERVEERTEDAIDAATADHPELAGKSFIWGALSTADLSSISFYTPQDARPLFLTELGMVNAPVIEDLSEPGQFYGTVSAERSADLDSDVMITYGEKESDAETYAADPLVGQIPAVESGHLATFLADPVALSGTIPTPLAIPYAVEHFVPAIVAALA